MTRTFGLLSRGGRSITSMEKIMRIGPPENGSSHQTVLAYGVFATVGGGILLLITGGDIRERLGFLGYLALFLGGGALLIGVVWWLVAPAATLGGDRPSEAFVKSVLFDFKYTGAKGVKRMLAAKGDNLQAKGLLRSLKKQIDYPDADLSPSDRKDLKDLYKVVDEYCRNPSPNKW